MILNLVNHIPLNFIIINDKFLFQDFDSIQIVCHLFFSKHDFTKVTLSENSKEIEIIQSHFSFTGGLASWVLYDLLLCGRDG